MVSIQGTTIVIRCGQELNEDGSVRYNLRANCIYEERWILKEGLNNLEWFDYKSFRYVELIIPEQCEINDVSLRARHYPFELKAKLKKEYMDDVSAKNIWNMCVHTQKYGVQEVIQDCMEREKGFYLGDGCYTALTNMILTQDDSMVKKLIDDAFSSSFITSGLVTCLDCSFMQEIAEFPLMLIYLVLWHYRLTGDIEFLELNFQKVINLLEEYRHSYENEYLLSNIDKWCVVEWPKNYQDNYDVDITEGKICKESHVVLNAYYIEAIKAANIMSQILKNEKYRNEEALVQAFKMAFYDEKKHMFKDSKTSQHISVVGNIYPFAFGLCPDDMCKENIVKMILERGIRSISLFCTFPVFIGLIRNSREDLLKKMILDNEAWIKMLEEGATTTFECWGKNAKWNTSLFHLTLSYVAVFMADIDHKRLFE